MKKVAVLGSTGSIGTQTLDVVRANDDLEVVGLAAGSNVEMLEKQIREFHPRLVAVWKEEAARDLAVRVQDLDVKIVSQMGGLIELARMEESDILVTAIVGMIGIRPTMEAILAGKDIALANKETLVTAGHLIMPLAKQFGVQILPVDCVFFLVDCIIIIFMIYSNDIVSIDIDIGNKQIYDIVCQHLYQVYPVTQDNTLDNIIGVVYLKDLFGKLEEVNFNLRDVIRPAQYFHENMDVYKVLEQIRQHHIKYGLICDEFGSLQGVITMKDILEALVGALPGDSEEPDIILRKDGSWLIDGQCSFYDFLSHFVMEDLYSEYYYNTLSGLILQQLGHDP